MRDERTTAGERILEHMAPGQVQRLAAALEAVAPDMVRFVVDFGYGDVLSRPGLDLRSRQVATVAALAGLGTAREQLAFHVGASLTAGLSPAELVETAYLVTVFAGFPAGLNALAVMREVFTARGVAVDKGSLYDPSLPGRRERGLAALEATSKGAGRKVIESLADIAPDFAGFILDFSYGDVISRRILSPAHKEIAMIAVAAARGTMRPQLMVHIHAALAVGVERAQVVEVLVQMAGYAGFPAALNALEAAREAFGQA